MKMMLSSFARLRVVLHGAHEFFQVFDLIKPAMISKLFPSGCKSMKPSSPEDHPVLSGTVRNSPWSGVIPVTRTAFGGLVVVSVTNWSLHRYVSW